MSADRALAEWLHGTYEEAAAEVGWDTQDGTSVPFEDLPDDNREVMLEVARRLNERLRETSFGFYYCPTCDYHGVKPLSGDLEACADCGETFMVKPLTPNTVFSNGERTNERVSRMKGES